MAGSDNRLRWDGSPGHYEVYYLSATDPDSGVGLWIRYTLLAPLDPSQQPTCALWVMAMDPHGSAQKTLFARKQTFAISALQTTAEPFRIDLGQAWLSDHGMCGTFQDVSWELHYQPRLPTYRHVHPILRRAGIAKTVLELPHPDLEISGTVSLAGRELQLRGAHGGQAHLWGSKHAARWAWLHAGDLRLADGSRAPDSFVDAVSVFVPRLRRELGPSTPLVARFFGEDFICTSPLQVMRNSSRFGLTHWQLHAHAGNRRLRVDLNAPREHLLGVTYQDPDGQRAYCYNTEVASLRLNVFQRTGRGRLDWALRHELHAPAVAHFEYAQRQPIAGMPLLV